MISFIEGKLVAKYDGFVVIENNGIGYEISVSNNTLVGLPNTNEVVRLFTNLIVREDGISLFGFSTLEEKDLFNKLTTVSGVGAKSALMILSSQSYANLVTCIINGDVNTLSKAKGIGKKTAERVILELKDKMDAIGAFNLRLNADEVIDADRQDIVDAIDVLVSLGIPSAQATNLVKKYASECKTAEEFVSKVLQNLNN